MNIVEKINHLRRKKNAIILAHYYQTADIQDIADYVGDSLGLAQVAEKTKADMIVFSGVHFMAETAKILNLEKKVVLPDIEAGCSLADACPPEQFREFIEKHPDHLVVSYINCSAVVKTMSDIICTSGNAVKIIESIPKEQKIIFAPDKNLGAYINQKTGRDMLLWDGTCEVHDILTTERIIKLKMQHPDAMLIAHPECKPQVLALAGFIGSTTQLIKFAKTDDTKKYIVATESGILHQMRKESPGKEFMVVPSDETCTCNDCPYMKLNTMEKLFQCMKKEHPDIMLEQEVIDKAAKPIVKMLEISRKEGLIQ